jgi:uncharacterized membrane protein YjgN (DUF898 family)
MTTWLISSPVAVVNSLVVHLIIINVYHLVMKQNQHPKQVIIIKMMMMMMMMMMMNDYDYDS